MDRITPKEVLSMMDAVAQVYEQPEKDQVDEKQEEDQVDEAYSQAERKSVRDQLSKIPPSTPDYASMSDDEFAALVKKSGNPEGLISKRKDQQAAAAKNTVPAGSFNISPKGSDRRNEVEAQIKKDNAARTDDQRVEPETAPKPAPKPELTDQQKVRAEYDRLRYSKDPKERAQAAAYGKAMASAGAAKKDFSGYKSAADLAKSNSDKSGTISGVMSNKSSSGSGPGGYQTSAGAKPTVVTPASSRVTSGAYKPPVGKPAAAVAATATKNYPGGKVGATGAAKPTAPTAAKPAGSIAQRLQAIRDMRARSQARITSQGGTPATPAVTSSQQSSIQQKVDKVKQPVQSKPQPTAATGSTIRNPNRNTNFQVNGNTYKPGEEMSVGDSAAVRDAQSQIRNNLAKPKPKPKPVVPTGNTVKTKVNPDSSIQVTQKRSPEATNKIRDSLNLF